MFFISKLNGRTFKLCKVVGHVFYVMDIQTGEVKKYMDTTLIPAFEC